MPSRCRPIYLLHRRATVAGAGLALLWCALAVRAACASWSVAPHGSVTLVSGPVAGIRELSGVTYLGPVGGGLERFAAVQDEDRRIVLMDVRFAFDGAISSATAVSALELSAGSDYEGIAFTGPDRNTVFVSEESTPGVHEHSLGTGARIQTVALPAVFQNDRANRGFEALTRSADGATMWTANEEALVVDGPAATQAHGTTVRLQRLTDNGVSVSAGPQFAYHVDPIHAGSGPDRSGLVDLVVLPDDSLLALERSFTNGLPLFNNRIYQVDFSGATDVSTPAYAAGLDGTAFMPVGKTLLWSGQAAGLLSNLEGIALGPQLANNKWVLLGVVDNSGVGSNPIVAFELTRNCPLAGDYDCSGAVDGSDYELWAKSFGSSGTAMADGNSDGLVDAADYVVWRANVSTGTGIRTKGERVRPVPEPRALPLLTVVALAAASAARTFRAGPLEVGTMSDGAKFPGSSPPRQIALVEVRYNAETAERVAIRD